jgi:heterodisulfide reductase subunit A
MTMANDTGRVLVVGAGVAGIRAALDLAESGYEVLLTESSPAIGGILSKLDNQFPSDHCGMCRMLPYIGRDYASEFCMRKSLFHDNITILPNTDVISCLEEPNRFSVTLRHRPFHVSSDACLGEGECGECVRVCPVQVRDSFNEGLTLRKAIYRPVPHNLPNLFVVDRAVCKEGCDECMKVCPTRAIDLDAKATEAIVSVGAVVLAAGTGFYEPGSDPDFYSYTRSPNVVTSLEFERMISPSGTYLGELVRPHDGRPIRKVAWLQCVGSRNRKQGRDFCSSICCMFALKEAQLAKERGGPNMDATVFYMDMRTFGRDYYRYRAEAEERGVRLVRCRAHTVNLKASGDPVIRFFDDAGNPHEEDFDLVVLAAGQSPPADVRKMHEVFDVDLNEFGYVKTDEQRNAETSRPGVFVCGSFTGLKDISESLVQGSAAAAGAAARLRSSGFAPKESPSGLKERSVERECPKVDILLCKCPLDGDTDAVDFKKLAGALEADDRVAGVQVIEDLCNKGLEGVREILGGSKANRVLFGACLQYVYKNRIRDLAREAGFNPSLVSVVDLRGQVQRPLRKGLKEEAAPGALSLLRTGVEELCARDPAGSRKIPVEQRALVVGGGLSGMQAALSLARHGIEVVLVEKGEKLGGHALNLRFTLEGFDPRLAARKMRDEVLGSESIKVHVSAEVADSVGEPGAFVTRIRTSNRDETVIVTHGATIVATGGSEAPTDEYGLGQSDAIMTQEELEKALADGSMGPDRLGMVVMIQCVGSREKGKREYCSRLCCGSALKNAGRILEVNPEARVLVLYRDMMTFGFKEKYYTEARTRGILFNTYELDSKPEVTLEEGKPVLKYRDAILGKDVEARPDLVVLSTGVVPSDNRDLARVLGIELGPDGFFKEFDYKWKPVETVRPGVYICGLANSPRSIPEALAMAEAAAQRALVMLSRKELETARLVSEVRHSICALCELCVSLCPQQARRVDPAENRIVVDALACLGCGICAAACPSSAAIVTGHVDRQVMAGLDVRLGGPG